jgi:hypothetical protein
MWTRLQRTTQLVWHVLESFGIAVSGLCIRPKRVVERSGGECLLFKVLARLDSKSVTLLNAALQGLFTICALVLASRPFMELVVSRILGHSSVLERTITLAPPLHGVHRFASRGLMINCKEKFYNVVSTKRSVLFHV